MAKRAFKKIVDKCKIEVGDDDSTDDGVEEGDNLEIDETYDPEESNKDGAPDGAPDDVDPNNVDFVAFPDPPSSPPRNPGAESVSQNLISIINRQTTSVPPQINAPPIPTDVTLRPWLTVYQNTYQIIFLVGNSVNPIANHEQKYILE